MSQIRVALVQANPTVGDLTGNADQVLTLSRAASQRGAHVVMFPEMFLTGYPIEDLALRGSFVDASRYRVETVARQLKGKGLGDLVVIVGYLDRADELVAPELGRPIGSPQNAVAVIHDGQIVGRYAKHNLPNYGVFDEFRYFVPGDRALVVRVHGVDIGIAVCEDLWREHGRATLYGQLNVGLIAVVNGSPYELNKDDVRLELCTRRVAEAGSTLAYVNMTGGQDELVFDGDSLVVAADGTVLGRAHQFGDELLVVDLDLPAAGPVHERADVGYAVISEEPLAEYAPISAPVAPRLVDEEEVYAAIVAGLHDYVEKNGFQSVILGLSGGIDSALTAVIACDALGADRVYGVSMPSIHSSEHSKSDAKELADRTGAYFLTVPITPMVNAFHDSLTLDGLAAENLQARMRGMTLMSLSNQEGHLVLATGNNSELAVGYSTMYGDAVGGFAPLKDVPKTLVWRLARWRNAVAEGMGQVPPIPEASIEKPPSAELRPDQLDTDSLPDYEVLDRVIDGYVESDRSAAQLVDDGFDPALVEQILQMVDRAEYKRRQYPPGPKISFKAFGRDRRLPITNSWREHAPEA